MLLNKLQKIKLTDKLFFERYRSQSSSMSCEQSFLNLFCWQESCGTLWCEADNHLWVWYAAENALLFPLGDFLPPHELMKILSQLSGDAQGHIYDVPPEYLNYYPEIEDIFTISADEAEFDYIYETEKLIKFSGKKLRKKRNLLKQFIANNPDYSIEPLSSRHCSDCIELATRISKAKHDSSDDLPAIKYFFAAFSDLKDAGWVIYSENRLIGFSVLSQLNGETYCEHFEKVDHTYKGAAQMLVNVTATQLGHQVKYINREQDMGIPGLRHTKRSYDPSIILKRYQLRINS